MIRGGLSCLSWSRFIGPANVYNMWRSVTGPRGLGADIKWNLYCRVLATFYWGYLNNLLQIVKSSRMTDSKLCQECSCNEVINCQINYWFLSTKFSWRTAHSHLPQTLLWHIFTHLSCLISAGRHADSLNRDIFLALTGAQEMLMFVRFKLV